ncbi:MAG: hypothetical protein HC840_03575 [Leptolyngbyaceae cyanobacterium RM2_2_4]|nr:hypothetical protein [Leptolyngbyaceae cyanobacterium RM2_2_4]
MPQRITALITANVFQNGLSRCEESWRYYTVLLRRLAAKPVDWYISDLDFDLAFVLWHLYQFGGDQACRAAYEEMMQILRICKINESILENSKFYRLNFYDSLRLACSVDCCVDAIVTWEPNQFATSDRERSSIREKGYFYRNFNAEMADDQTRTTHSIGVFSVDAFLLHLHELETTTSSIRKAPSVLQIESLEVQITRSIKATVTLQTFEGRQFRETTHGRTPCDALYKAIDRCVDRHIQLPERNLVYFSMPDTIGGADAVVEVCIRVECGDAQFEASATNDNVLWAFGDAYVAAINSIYAGLSSVWGMGSDRPN